jgi:hypothetical protein
MDKVEIGTFPRIGIYCNYSRERNFPIYLSHKALTPHFGIVLVYLRTIPSVVPTAARAILFWCTSDLVLSALFAVFLLVFSIKLIYIIFTLAKP